MFKTLASPCLKLLLGLSNVSAKLDKKTVSLSLQLFLNRVLAQETLPPLELSKQLRRSQLLSEDLFPKLLANFLLHGLKDLLILCLGLGPVLRLIFIGIERVDLAEGVEGGVNIQSLLFFRGQESQKLIMLGAKFKYFIDSDDHVIKIRIRERLSLPLMLN